VALGCGGAAEATKEVRAAVGSTTARRPATARRSGGIRLRHGRLLLRASTVAIVGVAVWSFLLAPIVGHFVGNFEDFSAYIGAGRNMAAGHSPYAAFDGNVSVVMTGFDYPPFASLLVRPLALLSDGGAVTLWLWLSLACTVVGALVLARTALPAHWPRTELALLAAFGFAPAAYNYWHGQMNPVIFLLLALAFRTWVQGRELSTGALLGLAAGIKLSPIVLVVLLLRRGWWRGTAVMAGTVVASIAVTIPVIGFNAVHTFLTVVLPTLTRETGWIYNQSLGGLLSRVTDHSVLLIGPTSWLLHGTVFLVAAVVLGFAAWRVRPGDRDPVERGAEFGLGVTAMLLAASIAWFPHFTHLLIPLAAGAALIAQRGLHVEKRLAQAAVATLVVFGLVVPLVVASIDMQTMVTVHGTAGWWPFLQLFSLPGVTAAVLFLALRNALRTPRAQRPPQPVAA
jgi:alpha-1,2-mannosyltransferase